MMPQPPRPARLDHDLYEARIAAHVPPWRWPGERAAAAFVLVRVEALELDAPGDAIRDPGLRGDFGNYFPDFRAHSLVEYGNRIGVFRLLDLLQPLGWQVAAAVNGLIAAERPALPRALAARGVELLASGWSASRMTTSAMPVDEERRLLAQSVDALAQAVGARPRGYASQDYGHSLATAELLESMAFDVLVDWPNDELPYAFGPRRSLTLLPAAAELDDAQCMLVRKVMPRTWGTMVDTALRWWDAHALAGSVLALPLRAWVAGAAHRAAVLRRALAAVPAATFWQAPPSAIAQAYRARPQVRR